jgi:hypothetical protein
MDGRDLQRELLIVAGVIGRPSGKCRAKKRIKIHPRTHPAVLLRGG